LDRARAVRLLGRQTDRGRDIEQCLLDEPRHHPGIGAAAVHRGNSARTTAAQLEEPFAQRVIRSFGDRQFRVGVKSGPRLDDGVDVKSVDVLGEVHEVDRAGVDRKIDDHAAARSSGQKRRQHVAIVFFGDGGVDETQLAVVEQTPIVIVRRDDNEFRPVKANVALDQGQSASTDRTEAEHYDRPVEARMQRPSGGCFGHGVHIRRSFRDS
jgi:hypothetical protein